jgi:hypothetical protein
MIVVEPGRPMRPIDWITLVSAMADKGRALLDTEELFDRPVDPLNIMHVQAVLWLYHERAVRAEAETE